MSHLWLDIGCLHRLQSHIRREIFIYLTRFNSLACDRAGGKITMALDIVGLIGAILLGVGLVMFLIGMIALAGGKRNWQRSVAVAGVGAVIAVVGFLLGGAAFLSSLYAGGATQPSTPGATWNIQFSGTS